MYPLDFPLRVLQRARKSRGWVLDPFCGRGTTNFAARLLGMSSIGIDSSPVAAALANAKLVHARPDDVVACAQGILSETTRSFDAPSGEFWELAYHKLTLNDLCRLRDSLLSDCSSPIRILLRAIVLGALHGPRPKGQPSYFSNQSPRTFAPKPQYAVRFWKLHDLRPEPVNVLAVIQARAKRYLTAPLPSVEALVHLADSRDQAAYRNVPDARWIVTSPPYYGMRTYIPDQWLRNWFLGADGVVDYKYPSNQIEHTGPAHFSAELARVWANVAKHSTSDARLIIRFGGIHNRDADPMEILRASLVTSEWKITTARQVPDADRGRRQVRQFYAAPRKSVTEYDVYCHRK